jgi:hypothetical protein
MSRIRSTGYKKKSCILLLILDLLWLNWQVYVDLAVDENGLWAIMAMRENNNTLILKVRYLVYSLLLLLFLARLSIVSLGNICRSLSSVSSGFRRIHVASWVLLVPDIRVEQGTEMFRTLLQISAWNRKPAFT